MRNRIIFSAIFLLMVSLLIGAKPDYYSDQAVQHFLSRSSRDEGPKSEGEEEGIGEGLDVNLDLEGEEARQGVEAEGVEESEEFDLSDMDLNLDLDKGPPKSEGEAEGIGEEQDLNLDLEGEEARQYLKSILKSYHYRTESPRAKMVLDNFLGELRFFWLVTPKDMKSPLNPFEGN